MGFRKERVTALASRVRRMKPLGWLIMLWDGPRVSLLCSGILRNVEALTRLGLFLVGL